MEINELIICLSNMINAKFRNSDNVSYFKDSNVNKACLELDNVVLERYFGDNKKGFSIRFKDNNILIICLNEVVIISEDNNTKSYPINIIDSNDKEKLREILQNTINKFEILNKHK